MIPKAVVKTARLVPTKTGGELIRLEVDTYQSTEIDGSATPVPATLYLNLSKYPWDKYWLLNQIKEAVITNCSISRQQSKTKIGVYKHVMRATITCPKGAFDYDYASAPSIDSHSWWNVSKKLPKAPSPVVKTGELSTGVSYQHAGTIYIAVNECMPGLVKIGMTAKDDPAFRLRQISSMTATPTPLVLVFSARFANRYRAEELIHKALSEHGILQNKEFFRIDIAKAIHTVVNLHRACGAKGHPFFAWDEICRINNKWRMMTHKSDETQAVKTERSKGAIAHKRFVAEYLMGRVIMLTIAGKELPARWTFEKYLQTRYHAIASEVVTASGCKFHPSSNTISSLNRTPIPVIPER